jgi:hypothetical protein
VLATDANAAGTLPMSGTLSVLDATVDNFASGTVVVTVVRNGVATSVTCTLTGGGSGNETCTVPNSSLAISPGDTLSLQVANNSGTFLRDIRWSADITTAELL